VRASKAEVRATVRPQNDGDSLSLGMRFWSSWCTEPPLYLDHLQDPVKILGQDNHLQIIFRIIRPLVRSLVASETSQTGGMGASRGQLDRGNTTGEAPR